MPHRMRTKLFCTVLFCSFSSPLVAQSAADCFLNPSLCLVVKDTTASSGAVKGNVIFSNIINGLIEEIYSDLDLSQRIGVQKSLSQIKLYKAPIDGVYGRNTEEAIATYLRARNIDSSSSNEVKLALSVLAEISLADDVNFQEATFFINDIEEYVSSGDSDFDLQLALEFGKIRDITSEQWNPQIRTAFLTFREYALSNPGFQKFHNDKSIKREREINQQIKEKKEQISTIVSLLRTWAEGNLLDPMAEDAILAIDKTSSLSAMNDLKYLEEVYLELQGVSSRIGLSEPDQKNYDLPPLVSDSIYIFGNFTGAASSIFRGISGAAELDGAVARVCAVGELDKWQQYAIKDYLLGSLSAEELIFSSSPCSGSEDLLIGLGSQMVSQELPVVFSSSYEEIAILDRKTSMDIKEKLDLMSQIYLDDVTAGKKSGNGIISFDSSRKIICSIVQEDVSIHVDGLKANQNILEIFGASVNSINQPKNVIDAFRKIQRKECGFVYAAADDLATLIEAANNSELEYVVLPIWISNETIKALTDKKTELEKDRLSDEEARLQNARLEAQAREELTKKALSKQSDLRKKYEVRFSSIVDRLATASRAAVDFGFRHSPLDSNYQERYLQLSILDPDTGKSSAFDPIIDDIQNMALEKWEQTGFSLQKIDYGIVTYNTRSLEGIVVELRVELKNRVVGDFTTYCRTIRAIQDGDFDVWRQIEIDQCGSDGTNWKLTHSFNSQWIVETDVQP